MSVQSKVDPSKYYDANRWVISLVDTKERSAPQQPDERQKSLAARCSDACRGHIQIVVEGIENGKPLLSRYDIIKKSSEDHFSSPFQQWAGNQQSVMAQPRRQDGYSQKSYQVLAHDSHLVPRFAARRMIRAIEDERQRWRVANAAGTLREEFPFQTAGSSRTILLGGNGGDNCYTWAMKMLAIAGISNQGLVTKAMSKIKAFPAMISFPNRVVDATIITLFAGVVGLIAYRRTQ